MKWIGEWMTDMLEAQNWIPDMMIYNWYVGNFLPHKVNAWALQYEKFACPKKACQWLM